MKRMSRFFEISETEVPSSWSIGSVPKSRMPPEACVNVKRRAGRAGYTFGMIKFDDLDFWIHGGKKVGKTFVRN